MGKEKIDVADIEQLIDECDQAETEELENENDDEVNDEPDFESVMVESDDDVMTTMML